MLNIWRLRKGNQAEQFVLTRSGMRGTTDISGERWALSGIPLVRRAVFVTRISRWQHWLTRYLAGTRNYRFGTRSTGDCGSTQTPCLVAAVVAMVDIAYSYISEEACSAPVIHSLMPTRDREVRRHGTHTVTPRSANERNRSPLTLNIPYSQG
jgi:hypothetical protein